MKKRIPKFKSDADEARFWDTHSTAEFWDEMEPADDVKFARAPREVVTLRLDRPLIRRLKAIAERRGLAFSTLIRMWIVERCAEAEKPPAGARRRRAQ